MKTIKLTAKRTFTKTAVIEIQCPEDLDTDKTSDYLYTNPGLFKDILEQALNNAKLDCDKDLDEVRFDVIESITITKRIWGGTL